MKKIIFLGHSILSLYKKERIKNWQIYNVSKQGIITKEGLQIAKTISERLTESDAILIMFGINELYYQMKEDSIIKYLEQLLVFIRKTNPKIIIVLAEIIQTAKTNRLNPKKISWVNKEIHKLSRKFQTKILTWDAVYDSKGQISEQNTIDGIHLTKSGYSIFEECLSQLLKSDE